MIERLYAQLGKYWKPKRNPKKRGQPEEAEEEEEEKQTASPEGAARSETSESLVSLDADGADGEEESRVAQQLGFPVSPETPQESFKSGLTDDFENMAINSGKKALKPAVVEISDFAVKPQPPVKKGITMDATREQQLRWLQCLS